MLFDIESFDYSYYNEGSEGLKLALVHHLDMPIMRQKGYVPLFESHSCGKGGCHFYSTLSTEGVESTREEILLVCP